MAKREDLLRWLFEQAQELWGAAFVRRSGVRGEARFEIAQDACAAGSIHAIARERLLTFPLDVAILVLKVSGDQAEVCPLVVPPCYDPRVENTDRWLPSDHSPLRVLPGSGVMQVRARLSACVPCASLGSAIRRIPLERLEREPPAEFDRVLRYKPTVEDWSQAWARAVTALQGTTN